MHQCTPLERAFEIARSGKANTTSDIQKALKSEGYADDELYGPYLLKQLRVLMKLSAGKKQLDAGCFSGPAEAPRDVRAPTGHARRATGSR